MTEKMTEKKEVKSIWYETEKQIMEKRFYEMTGEFGLGGCIQFYNLDKNMRDERVDMGVNWGGFGTVSPAEAAEFASKLQIAIALASNFKYNGFVISYESVTEEEKAAVMDYRRANGL